MHGPYGEFRLPSPRADGLCRGPVRQTRARRQRRQRAGGGAPSTGTHPQTPPVDVASLASRTIVVVAAAVVVVVVVAAAVLAVALQHGMVVGHGELGSDPRHLLQKITEPSTVARE